MKKIIRLTESDLKRLVEKVLEEQNENYDDLEKYYVEPLLRNGFKLVSKIDLPDGVYKKFNGGYYIDIYNQDKSNTGYRVVMKNGIRGMWKGEPVKVVGGTIPSGGMDYKGVYKIFYKPEESTPSSGQTSMNEQTKVSVGNVIKFRNPKKGSDNVYSTKVEKKISDTEFMSGNHKFVIGGNSIYKIDPKTNQKTVFSIVE